MANNRFILPGSNKGIRLIDLPQSTWKKSLVKKRKIKNEIAFTSRKRNR